jgi:HAD superfamily hydrolase (TIGR01490 family)
VRLALFDLDGTLLPIDSDHAFGDYLVQRGWADAEHFKRGNDAFYAQYLAGRLDVAAYIAFCTTAWRDRPAAELQALQTDFIRDAIGPQLLPPARDLVRRHQDAGDLVAIVTATNEVVTRPIADAFGVEHLIALKLARDAAGRVTGAIDGVPSYQAGKIVRVEQWLATLGRRWDDFDDTVFYSDSTNDLPLLERVRRPVATNPTPALEAIARERGWPVLRLFA